MPLYKNKHTSKSDHFEPDSAPRSVFAVGGEILDGRIELAEHQHHKGQLIYMTRGILTCEVAKGLWILAPGSALWIPGGTDHSVRGVGPIETYCLFIDENRAPHLPKTCCTLAVSSLLREVIFRCAQLPMTAPLKSSESRLLRVLLDELAAAPLEKMHLPMPQSESLRSIADAMIANPSDRASIGEWAQRLGLSERTLARLTVQDLGMSFGRWRQQLHISLALQWLVQGVSVQKVASDLGYESASSFVLMFRKALGSPPVKYLANRTARSSKKSFKPS